ncbi:hypothetical protein BDY19DRAFT_519581 [Irpex rosettiformis]|uniref:Uncharacterized protein n=1 Tax=Irpex rosettiformis TaxID=378272 RepID=A0ACB8TRV3_9APHY|nr:hypothetical protein BDY19DRAFT_519581 [Irpex rosettiformis]
MHSSLFLIILPSIYVLSLISRVVAQDFAIPSFWRKPTSALSHQARLGLIDGLFNTITRTYDKETGLFNGVGIPGSPHILHALSSFDYFNGSTTNQELVTNSLNTMFTLVPTIIAAEVPQANSDAIYWGLAAMNAYRAYKDESLIKYAEAMWKQGSVYMVTPQDAAAGTHPMRNVSIKGTCYGVTTAGAVFWIVDQHNNTFVNGETTGSLFVLSARLYQHTNDTQYLDTMNLTLDFLTKQLYNGNIIQDTIDLANCNVYSLTITQNSGWAIDGLTTVVGMNSSWTSFLSNLVSTVIPNPAWTNITDGVITEGPKDAADATTAQYSFLLKGIYIRGLYERYRLIPPDSNEAVLIQRHITVQFNALLDLASTPGSHQYSPRWEGPPPPVLLPYGQLSAANVLIAAAGFPADSDNNTETATPSSSPAHPTNTQQTQSGTHRNNSIISNAAIGGIVAGVIILVMIVAALWIVVRRRARRELLHENLTALETAAHPYLSQIPRALGDSTMRMIGEEERLGVAVRGPARQSKRSRWPGFRHGQPLNDSGNGIGELLLSSRRLTQDQPSPGEEPPRYSEL